MTQDQIRQLADAICVDLYDAMAFYEVFCHASSNADLIARVNELGVDQSFKAISHALEHAVIAALCRNWDKTSGTARIPEVAAGFRRNPRLAADQARLAEWLTNVRTVELSHELKALRTLRNVSLAHRENPNTPSSWARSNSRRARQDDIPWLLQATISIVDELRELMDYSPIGVSFRDLSSRWQQRALEFWRTVGTERQPKSSHHHPALTALART
jgi:hypothetical protein